MNTLDTLNSEWKTICKTIFGAEIGSLSNYEKWLLAQKEPSMHAKSTVSNKEIFFPCTDYGNGAKYADFLEISKLPEMKLDINKIKDIDSIWQQIGENIVYCGNLHLGNCGNISQSSDVADSHFVHKSARVYKSEYIAYSTIQKEQKYMFGCSVGSQANYGIRCHQNSYTNRCFECTFCTYSSDVYYSFYTVASSDCMFCFNQKSARNMIGNLALQKQKYLDVKKHLIEQMREELERKKRLPMLSEILFECKPTVGKSYCTKYVQTDAGKLHAQKHFESTSKILGLGGLASIDEYENWLSGHTLKIVYKDSCLGSGGVPSTSYQNHNALPLHLIVNINEAHKLSELKIDETDLDEIDFSEISGIISKVAFISPQFLGGKNQNMTDCPIMLDCSDSYKVHGAVFTKNCALTTWPNGSENLFGCAFAMDCKYCINCYNSFDLTRCFECDACRNSEDCMFCHNIENCQNCMFCFNTKAKRYAIANVEYSKEEYMALKKKILGEISAKLEKDKKLELSIFNLGLKSST